MANTLELKVFADGVAAKNWWQWSLVGVIAFSGVIGIFAAIWYVIGLIRNYSPVSTTFYRNDLGSGRGLTSHKRRERTAVKCRNGFTRDSKSTSKKAHSLSKESYPALPNRLPLEYIWERSILRHWQKRSCYFDNMISWFLIHCRQGFWTFSRTRKGKCHRNSLQDWICTRC